MSSASPPPASTRSRPVSPQSGRLIRGAALLACLVVVALGIRFWRTPARVTPSAALRLDENVVLTAPPPLPGFSARQFRAALEQRQAARTSLSDEDSYRKFARDASLGGDPLTAYLALRAYLRGLSQPSPSVLDASGRLQMQLGLAREAERTYRAVVAKAPQTARGYLGLSRALVVLERRKEAADTLEAGWNALAPGDIKGRLDMVEEWEQRGELPRALQAVERLEPQSSSSPEITLTRARLLFKQHRLNEARQALEPLIAAHPDHGPARTLMAGILASPLLPERNPADAETALLEAIQRNTADIASLSRLGQLYQEQGRLKQAAYIYIQMLAHAPDSPDARLQLARAYALMGNPTGSAEQNLLAQKQLRQRLEEERLTVRRDQKPGDAAARRALARYYMQQGRYDKALPELQAAFALQPRSAAVFRELQTLYAKIGLPLPASFQSLPR